MNGPSNLPHQFQNVARNTVQSAARQAAPFSLRLSDKERARLRHEAGSRSLGGYIRLRLFESGKPLRSELAEVLGLLGQSQIADNLQTLADEALSGSLLLDKQTLKQIAEACAHIAHMWSCLIKALGLLER